MAEYPPISRIHVVGYSANDTDYPILNLVADPRVAGYKVPEDFSICPDKRYPSHIFTGAQPISGDQRVRHIWEILPSPWVPFTRYDDDLGPIQGRRRSVKNEGQTASLTSDKRVTYEAREGSAIVYTELEESWSIKTDSDGNSLFPVRIRDFYDASRGAVEETRQLFVPTGEEVATLENNNGIITQTSYEPYNEYLSFKVVQKYAVDGPKLVGKATDNDGQLVTVTTQRKAALNYEAPSPTATKTVEASREDAESIVERVVDTPEVFGAETYRKTKDDVTPQKFRAAQEDSTVEQTVEGIADPSIVLASGEFAKSEQQVNAFLKRVATTSRNITENVTLLEKVVTPSGQLGTRVLTLASGDQSLAPSATLIDGNVEALGDGRTVKTETTVPTVFDGKNVNISVPDVIPQQFRATVPTVVTTETIAKQTASPALGANQIESAEERLTEFVVRKSTAERQISSFPILYGQEYDQTINAPIRYLEKITASGAELGGNAKVIDPLSEQYDLVREFDLTEIGKELDKIFFQFPTTTSLDLPPVLKSVKCTWDGSSTTNSATVDGNGFSVGSSTSLSLGESGDASASIALNPSFEVEMDYINGKNIPTTSYFFFLKYPVTVNAILQRVNAILWPILKPKAIVLSAAGITVKGDVRVAANASASRSEENSSASTSVAKSGGTASAYNTVSTTIPPCITTARSVTNIGPSTAVITVSASCGFRGGGGFPSVSASKSLTIAGAGKRAANIPASSPPSIPTSGRYLINSRVEIHQFGYAKVYAEVLDASYLG